jgi:dTDP-glucose 4,6-dehydratase
MNSIIVTGGAGFIGSNFVHHLLENNLSESILVIDKLTYAGNLKNLAKYSSDSRLKFIKIDITQKEELFKCLKENSFESIVHFAAESHVDRSITGPEDFVTTNVLGTFYLLEGFKQFRKESLDGRFLHVSTDEVYGTLGEDGFFSESTSYAPNSPYSASKASSDHFVRSYFHTYNLPVLTTNCSNNYGPFHFPEKLIPLMILNCIHDKPLPIYGEGKNIRDWLYVKDHCSAIYSVLKKGKIGDTYCIGTRNEKTNKEVVDSICNMMDEFFPKKAPHTRLIQYIKDRPGHDFRYAIDPSKIEKELGWTPKYQFDVALRETIQWYLNNENWWKEILSGDYTSYYQNQYGKV